VSWTEQVACVWEVRESYRLLSKSVMKLDHAGDPGVDGGGAMLGMMWYLEMCCLRLFTGWKWIRVECIGGLMSTRLMKRRIYWSAELFKNGHAARIRSGDEHGST
jgi:hypothetical protein